MLRSCVCVCVLYGIGRASMTGKFMCVKCKDYIHRLIEVILLCITEKRGCLLCNRQFVSV